MKEEKARVISYLYHGTWVLPFSLTTREFTPFDLEFNVDSVAVSPLTSSSSRTIVQKGSLDLPGFAASSDTSLSLVRVDFGQEIISAIHSVFNPNHRVHVDSVELIFLEFGVMGISLALRPEEPIEPAALEKSICDRLWDRLSHLFPIFDELLAELERRRLVTILSAVPRLSTRAGDTLVVPHRYDFVLVLENESGAILESMIDQFALDANPMTIDGVNIYTGFALHMVCCNGSLAHAIIESLQRVFLLGCGAFSAAADTAGHLTDLILSMLSEKKSLRSREVRSLILFAEYVLQRTSGKGALKQIEIELLARYNLKDNLEQEIEKLRTAERAALVAVEQRERERSSRAEQGVQGILLLLALLTVYSVVSDILGFWSLELNFVLFSFQTIALIILTACVVWLAMLGMRFIRRQ